MNYRLLRPSAVAVLARHVQSYWALDGGVCAQRQIVLPDGFVELVFRFGGACSQVRAGAGSYRAVSSSGSWASGWWCSPTARLQPAFKEKAQ